MLMHCLDFRISIMRHNLFNEAQLIQGKSMYGGKISLKRFFDELILQSKTF